ncbi:annexin A5b [Nematolebias whitei]|uniref:annexin A5b n=1 Tax=Nematolebias whitei TaxID=451745 RepID=UPI001898CC1A|nr:annexin A5b [Nematolebias whitei]
MAVARLMQICVLLSAPCFAFSLEEHLVFLAKPTTNNLWNITRANRGTVKASANFSATADAEVLNKAMKGLGTDEGAILQLVTARSNAQRQEIKTAYKTQFGKDLVDTLKGELGGKFETLIVALMTPPLAYDVTSIHNAIKGAGTDEKVLVQILASRTPQQVKDIVAAYKQAYDKDLEKDVSGDTSGHFKRLLVILLQGNRQTGIQEGNIESDAQVLFKAGEQKFGTDEQSFVTILGNRSPEHLRKVFDAYMKLSGYEIEESIKRETSGNLRALLLAVVKCARSVPAYFAETLYNAMNGAGTDDDTLIRVMVTRSEVDMLDIRAQFRKMFARSLYSMIKGDTSGDYRKALLLLCGGDDA